MHVVLLNQAFHPDIVATAQMGRDLAEALVRRGHTVTAIASRSMYGQKGAVLAEREEFPVAPEAPGDKGGMVRVRRVGSSLFGRAGTAARIFDFGMFYLRAAWALLTMEKPDVVVGFSTPPYIALLTLLCRFFRGSRAVYWAMDLYPEVMVPSGMLSASSPVYRLLARLHRLLVRRADATIVLGRCMQGRVLAALGQDRAKDKVVMIPVWSDEAGVTPVPREGNRVRQEWGMGDAFVVMYSGNFGIGHDASTVLDAMLRLKHRGDIRFIFVGGGKRRPEVEAFIREHHLSNARYVDYQPRERLAESLSAGDVHLISLRGGMEGLIVPSKLYGIMACARPSIFVGPESSEVARVLAESGSGVVVREGDGAGLAGHIESYAQNVQEVQRAGAMARRTFEERYTRRASCGAWCDLLERIP
ncbi:MAG: glycosyltransferase family 4 protein [Phycisphaerales bacterium]